MLAFAACMTPASRSSRQGAEAVPLPPIKEVLDRHAGELMAIPGVTLVYEGVTTDGRSCIRVGFTSLPASGEAEVPAELEGWPVVVEEVGDIRPLGD
jgi:hypothetical protein